MHKDSFDIIRQINELTLKIEMEHPELYRNLEEMPVKQKNPDDKEIDPHALFDYLINLKTMLKRYEEIHPITIKK